MILNVLEWVGDETLGIILIIANGLTESWAPGLVALVLLAGALAFGSLLYLRDKRRISALSWANREIETSKDRGEFRSDFVRVSQVFSQARNQKGSNSYRYCLGVAWGEYCETMVVPDTDSNDAVRNSLRPAIFFNAEDLDFEPGWWRILPGLFVSVGLFLTFLGLIAALKAISGDINDQSLKELLNAASAKFVMSLTGLACSIILTLVGRMSSQRVEGQIRSLCHAIEKRLLFQSMEEIAAAQLEAIKSSNDAMRHMATEMVEKISAPLRNEIPEAIGGAIRGELVPLLGTISQQSEEGLGQMVGDLSKRFSDDVGQALTLASDRLGAAADRFEGLTSKMEGGAGRMGQEYEQLATRLQQQLAATQASMQSQVTESQTAMNETVEKLLVTMNQSLEVIQSNTRAGADAIAKASEDMKEAAASFRQQMEGATEKGAQEVQENMARAAERAGETIASATSGLTDPLGDLAKQIEAAAAATQQTSSGLQGVADAAQKGGAAIVEGSQRYLEASDAMAQSAAPIRESVISLRSSTAQLNDGMSKALEANIQQAKTIAQSSNEALTAAVAVLKHEQQTIDSAMQGLARALQELRGQGDRLDDVDQKLGRALEQYRTQVEATVTTTQETVAQMTGGLTRALDTLREVVSQAEDFQPQSPANRVPHS